MIKRIAVLGAGSWGTTLAILLGKKNLEVKLWEFNEENVKLLNEKRENLIYLPGVSIPQNIVISSSINEVVEKADIIVFVIPTHVFRDVAKKVKNFSAHTIFVSASKGIENKTFARMSEIIKDETGSDRIVALSGPSHAEEVSREIPTAIVAASKNIFIAEEIQRLFSTHYFRVYTNTDIAGVEIGGSLKNIIAIASGIIDGLKLGDNTKAALITRGLSEIARFGIHFKANYSTFSGLSGLGDLVVTCTSKHSRNRLLGEKIGSGKTLNEALNEMIMVAEGVKTTISAYEIAKKNNIQMPITEEMFKVLYCNKQPASAVHSLMTREFKSELTS